VSAASVQLWGRATLLRGHMAGWRGHARSLDCLGHGPYPTARRREPAPRVACRISWAGEKTHSSWVSAVFSLWPLGWTRDMRCGGDTRLARHHVQLHRTGVWGRGCGLLAAISGLSYISLLGEDVASCVPAPTLIISKRKPTLNVSSSRVEPEAGERRGAAITVYFIHYW